MAHRRFLTALALVCILTAGQARAECEEVGYLATFDVKAGHQQAFEAAAEKLATKVRQTEEGILLYALFRGESETRYYMIERYRNERSRKMHARSPEVRALFGPLTQQLARPLKVEPIAAVCPPA